MKTTATELARHTAQILARVERGECVDVERHERPLAQLSPSVGVTAADLRSRLKRNPLNPAQRAQLLAAAKQAGEVFHACGD